MSADNMMQVLNMLESHCQGATTREEKSQCLLQAVEDMTAQSIQHIETGGAVLATAALNCQDSANFGQCSMDHAAQMQAAGGVHMAKPTASYSPEAGKVMVDSDMGGPSMQMY